MNKSVCAIVFSISSYDSWIMSLDLPAEWEWKQLEKVMIFIDGGYLRKLCTDYCGHDRINFTKLGDVLQRMYSTIPRYPFRMNLIRIYYYDAITMQ